MRTPTFAYYMKMKTGGASDVLDKGQLFCASKQGKSMKK